MVGEGVVAVVRSEVELSPPSPFFPKSRVACPSVKLLASVRVITWLIGEG